MDKKKDLYIFSDSSSVGCAKMWTWKCGIRDNVDLEYIDYDMSVYGIPRNLSDEEIERCNNIANYLFLGEEDFNRIKRINFSAYNKIVVWHSWDSKSLLVLYFICSITECDIYHINVVEQKEISHIKYMGEISNFNLFADNEIYKRAKLVDKNERLMFKEIWEGLYGTDLLPKVADGYKIICKDMNYVKEMILNHVTKRKQPAFGVIKKTISDYPKEILFCPYYLYYALLELAKEGKVSLIDPKKKEGQHLFFYPEETIIDGIDVSGSYSFDVKLK